MEPMVGARIDVGLIGLARSLERGLVCGPSLVHVGVQFAVVQQQRSLDARNVFRFG